MLQKKHKYIIVSAALLIIIFLLYRYFMAPAMQPYQEVKVVEAEKITLSSIDKSINLIGTIKAENSAMLVAQDYGILEAIVPAGTKVSKDTLIARIVNKQVKKRAELAAEAEVIAKNQLERANRLFKSGAYSKANMESSKNAWILAGKDLSDAQNALLRLEFRAPFDGIVGAYKVISGAQVKPDTQVISIYDPSKIRVEFDVPVSAVSYVNNGQSLSILGKSYQLTHIQKMLDTEKHMSPAFCDITCDNCIIGTNADVELILEHKQEAIVIPFEAVFLKNGLLSVYVIEDGKAVVRNIEQGIRQQSRVEVTKGLSVGEVFVAHNPARLYPGINVKLKE